MPLPQIAGQFRLGHEPELKFSPSGTAVARLRLGSNSRKKNDAGEWENDKECWLNANCFGKTAEHVAETLAKGTLVTVTGRLETQKWQGQDGQPRSDNVLIIDTIGPDLTFDVYRKVEQQATTAPGQPNDPWQQPAAATDAPPF